MSKLPHELPLGRPNVPSVHFTDLPEKGWGYVTCPRSERFFETLIALIDGHIDADVLVQELEMHAPDVARLYHDQSPETFRLASNNGADYLAAIRALCKVALGRDPSASEEVDA